MKCGNSNEVIHKDVVIIGNGPSGITLSYMLSGNVPYVTSNAHPDEFLSARLATVLNKNLIHEDLDYLSGGLEGRTTNPVSLLIDNLMHPCADIGLELEPLVEWRNDGFEFQKFGHNCEITSKRSDKGDAQESQWRRLFFINETNRRGYNYLRSQKKIENEYRKQMMYTFTIHPFSDFRKYWECIMIIVLLLQIYMFSIFVAVSGGNIKNTAVFSKYSQGFSYFLNGLSLLDVLLSFCTGYCNEKDSTVVIEPGRIISHYLLTNFVVDLICSLPLAMLCLREDSVLSQYGLSARAMLVIKLLCFIKICRVPSILKYVGNLFEAHGSSYLMFRMMLVLFSFLTYIHILSCIAIVWVGYGNPWSKDVSESIMIVRHYDPEVDSFALIYAQFFHSTCLMVTNSGYRLVTFSNASLMFTVNVWILSKLVFIFTLAYIMDLYSVSQSSKQKYIEIINDVKDCLKHSHIPEFLRKRILSYYDVKYQNYFFHEAKILNTVSGQLRQEIVMNTCRKLVESVAFFQSLPLALLVRIVSCLRYDIYLTNDVITKAGTPGDSMFFISYGTVAIYTRFGQEISHVVLGKGPPGGSWNSMDPQILTLSLGSWMGLPGLPYKSRNGSETRASAQNVADYYKHYVEQMGLANNFKNHTLVTGIKPYNCRDSKDKWVQRVDSDITKKAKLCARLEAKEASAFSKLCLSKERPERGGCTFSNAINYFLSRSQRKARDEALLSILGGDNKCDSCSREQRKNKKMKLKPRVPNSSKHCDSYRWLVEAVDLKTKECFTYTCDYLVVANGSSDLPNRLSISDYKTDPFWLLYDLRSLEIELDLLLQNSDGTVDPVLVIGAGLSAADAIIATRARNVDVLHLFRNKSSTLGKQLPENMYPEYHKVHQMMKNESKYPHYVPLPETTLTSVDQENRTVTLKTCEGAEETIKVSFVVVLIGAKPDMGFLPTHYNIAVKKNQPLDCKTNTVSINKFTHSVNGCDGLYALGPLAGDNFVRFLPGGALAVLSDLYKKFEL